jgi:hypothetical protein
MTDTSTFGGGLSFAAAGHAASVPGVDDASPSTTPDDAAGPISSGSAASQPTFGSNLTLGPRYIPPDPNATALDQSAALLSQRVQRAQSIASNPILQFFDPEGVQKARDFASGPGAQQLTQIQQARQQQTDIQAQATNYGMPKGQISPYMTGDTIDNYLLDRYKGGDFSVANALKARGHSEWVQDFAGAAVDGAGKTLNAADSAVTKLSAARDSQAAYDAARKTLTPEETQALTSMGVQSVPGKVTDWQGIVQQHGAKFAQAQALHAQVVQKLNNMTNFDGTVPKEVESASQGDITLGSTNEAAGFPVRTRSMDGQTGHVAPNGSARTDKYGMSTKDGGWSAWTPEREKSFQAMTNDENVKGAINQYNIANKVRDTFANDDMYKSAAGIAAVKDQLGTMRDVAEKSAAAGSIGFTKMFGMSQGTFESFVNKAQNEIGAFENWVNGGKKGLQPRMSPDTIAGLKLLSQNEYKFATDEAKSRLGGAMTYAGQGGKPLDQIPLDPALKNELADMHEQGRQDAINGWNAHPSLVRGNQRIFFAQGANVNGANPPRMQQSAPGSPPSASPAVPNQTAPSGGSGPAGVPPSPAAPITVAGQQVSFTPPPGASPSYLPALQRIESGNEASPWTAGTPRSSASGAFQFINSTWNDNKPPGAPARAGDATPIQQAQALATLTAKNSQALTTAGVPVNDTNLYVAHNLGADGAASLLKADPNADARTVVGETAAKNNPTFFKGRPTVAVALQRYDAAMKGGGTPDTATAEAPGLMTRISRTLSQGIPGGPQAQDAAVSRVGQAATENAPAIGSTLGAIGGSVVGPGGTIAGGAAGGGAGQSLKDYLQGRAQNPAKIAEQTALGGVLGVASEARPVLAAGARVLGAGAVEAGTTAAQGGSGPEITAAGLEGAGAAAGGELFGRALGMAGHKVFSLFGADAQKSVQQAAADLHTANETLKTELPKVPGAAGAASTANPKYDAAQAAKEKAEQTLKDAGLKPDEAAYAHKVTSEGVPKQEAQVGKPVAAAQADIGRGYQQLESEIGAKGVGAPKANGGQSQIEKSGEPAYGLGTDSMPIRDTSGKKVGDLDFSERPDAVKVTYPFVDPSAQGKGLAVSAYQKLIDYSLSRGKPVISDTAVTDAASNVYGALERRGYTVERNPNTKVVMGVTHSTDGKPVYRVTERPGVADGPRAAVAAGKVSSDHAELAQRTEMAITAPAVNWQDKWNQLKDARTALLEAERDALTSTATGRTQTAKDMRTLADTVRTQQEKAAKYVFGDKDGEAFIGRLKTLDVRYRNLMEATNGGDLAKAAAMTGEAGREADRKFRAFAYDDPTALAAWNTMRNAGRGNAEKDVRGLVGMEKIPVLGKVYSMGKMVLHFNEWMRQRTAGSPVKFTDLIKTDAGAASVGRNVRDLTGTAVQRGVVQGNAVAQ